MMEAVIDETKVNRLIDEMTLEEKAGMIHGAGLFRTEGVERLGIPKLVMSDGPLGVRFEFKDKEWIALNLTDDLITYCPSNSSVAATWNREIAYAVGDVLGMEARGRGKDIILAPGINVMRTPLCGRNFEYFSEDPYLIAQLAAGTVKGIEQHDVSSCVKHFAANSQETERSWVDVHVSERALRELYLPGFDAVINEAGAGSVMGAYNLFRGEHCCHNNYLLYDILRKEWGFDGLIISDWGGVHDTKKAAESPLDIEMDITYDFDNYYMANPLLEAVNTGEVAEGYVDDKVRNIIHFMIKHKMMKLVMRTDNDKEYVYAERNEERSSGTYSIPEHRQTVLEAARESVILLKNDKKHLPLDKNKLKKVLIVGDNAIRQHANGGGSGELHALYEITPILGIKSHLGGNYEVDYTPGYYVPPREETLKNWQETSLMDESEKKAAEIKFAESFSDKHAEYRAEAVRLAAYYDEVIYIGGLNHDYDAEGYDKADMKLPYEQDKLISELLCVKPNMTIVMISGNPVAMGDWIDKAHSVVWMSYAGMEAGNALADVLFGDVNPSGKLPMTIPYSYEDTPTARFGDYPGRKLTEEEKKIIKAHLTERYNEDIFVGYRYYDTYDVPVCFPFGYGLSYTAFSYGEAGCGVVDALAETVCEINIDIENTGNISGKEIVQLYVGAKEPKDGYAKKELKGFEKILLEAGEKKNITFKLGKKAFSHYHEDKGKWELEKGIYTISIGSSVSDIKTTIDVEV